MYTYKASLVKIEYLTTDMLIISFKSDYSSDEDKSSFMAWNFLHLANISGLDGYPLKQFPLNFYNN